MITDRRQWPAATHSMLSPLAMAGCVSVRATSSEPAAPVFPSKRYTVFDGIQKSLRLMQLPKPDCAVRISDCQDIDVMKTLEVFSTQPRISVPFTGDIDPASVNSQTAYLVNLGDTLTTAGAGQRVGIDQVLWDPATKTLVVESDPVLQEHARYMVVVSDGVRGASGKKLKSGGGVKTSAWP